MDIIRILAGMGHNTVPETFYSHIDTWKSWYQGKVRSFHSYSVYNGMEHVNCTRFSLGMGKKVPEDWANLLMNEKVKITLEGEREQDFIDSVFEQNNFRVKASEMQEMKAALGTVAYVPRIDGALVSEETGQITGTAERIVLDYVTADHIFPLSWENGRISECAFAVEKTVSQQGRTKGEVDRYVYLQIHTLDDAGNYVIENALFHDNGGTLQHVEPGTVKGFEHMAERITTGSPQRQFVIDRMNIANNIDFTLPLGISVFANAIDNLKGVDMAYDSYVNEFALGKKRIMVKPEATKSLDGEPYFDSRDSVFYILPEDSSAGSVIQPIDMTLRIAEHNAGIQDMLNLLSAKCGFGENFYKFNQGSIATATQVISENSTLFRSIKKHEIILESALTELCRMLLRLGNAYMNAGLDEDVELSIDFDDSIIESREQDEARVYMMLNAGLMKPVEARAMLMNEDEETAAGALPTMETLMEPEEPQTEVE